MTLQRVTISHIIFGLFLILLPQILHFFGGDELTNRLYEVSFLSDPFLLTGSLIILVSTNTFLSVRDFKHNENESGDPKKRKKESNV